MISEGLSGSACLGCHDDDRRKEGSWHRWSSMTVCIIQARSPWQRIAPCQNMQIHTTQRPLPLHSSSWNCYCLNLQFREKCDLWVKFNSHLLPLTSSGPYNDLPPSPIALLPCPPPPFPLILPITLPVCAPGGDHTVHLCTLTMFLQRAEADVEVFGLFFRSSPARNGAIPQNWRLIELWTDLASGAIRSYLAGESFAEPQFLSRHTSKSKTAWAKVQESGYLII